MRTARRPAARPGRCPRQPLHLVPPRSLWRSQRTAFELLDFYAKFADVDEEELEEALCAGLSVVGGGHPGAFILHDRTKHRVIAARMADGVDLFWGCVPGRLRARARVSLSLR